jgi:hypothetical protein
MLVVMKYVITNVRIEAAMLKAIKQRALQEGVPASAVIREALEKHLAAPPARGDWKASLEDFLSICGSAASAGPGTGSTDVDEALYGPRRKGPGA